MRYTLHDLKMMIRDKRNKKRFVEDDYEMFCWKYDLTRRQAISWCEEDQDFESLREYVEQYRVKGAVTFGAELDLDPHFPDVRHWRFWGYDEDGHKVEGAYWNVVYMKRKLYAFPDYWDAFQAGLAEFIAQFAEGVKPDKAAAKAPALVK